MPSGGCSSKDGRIGGVSISVKVCVGQAGGVVVGSNKPDPGDKGLCTMLSKLLAVESLYFVTLHCDIILTLSLT